MAGIYLHIPFCKKACHYCNFHFSTSLQSRGEMVQCLLMEAAMQQEYLAGETVETIYFGGGTPSLLLPEEIRALLETLHRTFPISPTPRSPSKPTLTI